MKNERDAEGKLKERKGLLFKNVCFGSDEWIFHIDRSKRNFTRHSEQR
jgi:hypothetical protein